MDATKLMPSQLDNAVKDELAALYPDDPHRAAAEAWEQYAAMLDAEPELASVSTGQQSVSYAVGSSSYSAAMKRATFHRSRARARSVQVAPERDVVIPTDDVTDLDDRLPDTGIVN